MRRTLDLLEPLYTGDHGIRGDGTVLDQAGKWRQRLAKKIDDVEIPIYANLATKAMDLVDLARLEKGMMLDVEFQLNNVCLTDKGNNYLFDADVDIRESEVVLRVTGGPANS